MDDRVPEDTEPDDTSLNPVCHSSFTTHSYLDPWWSLILILLIATRMKDPSFFRWYPSSGACCMLCAKALVLTPRQELGWTCPKWPFLHLYLSPEACLSTSPTSCHTQILYSGEYTVTSPDLMYNPCPVLRIAMIQMSNLLTSSSTTSLDAISSPKA